MAENPQKQTDNYSANKVKGKVADGLFRFNSYRDEMDRIKESVSKGQIYDHVPFPRNVLRLRPRTKGSEIGPEFHHKPQNEVERVLDLVREKTGKLIKGVERSEERGLRKEIVDEKVRSAAPEARSPVPEKAQSFYHNYTERNRNEVDLLFNMM